MKTVFKLKALTFFVCAFLVASMAFGQDMGKKQPLSPRDSVSGTIKGADIKINYGAPSVRNRKIFGDLQPYGKIWRAGANMMTTFETSKDIKVEGKTLPAGKYSLFAKPGETEWTIIFNSVTNAWGIKRGGDANDDPTKDVLVVTVKPKALSTPVERLVYKISEKGFSLTWENTEVFVKVK